MADDQEWLAERFEEQRAHLRAVAYRMLGSLAEADDAVQDTWLRVSRSGADDVENLGGWMTTIVARVCLNVLRSRAVRREESLGVDLPDAVAAQPEEEALLADSVGLALLVVLETLTPAERLAFVLHDTFAVPFDEIAPIVGRSPAAARQLASRARRRLRGGAAPAGADIARQREVVDAFLAAARGGDFDALLAVLDPDVVFRVDATTAGPGGAAIEIRGARAVAKNALAFSARGPFTRPILVDGNVGVVLAPGGRLLGVGRLTILDGRITEVDLIGDPARLARLGLAILDD
jgi:RNA polymerase sigma-70 factor (ECF subfamily)